MLLHPQRQAFQPQIQQKGVLGGLAAAKVPHQLGGALGNKRTGKAETLCVGDPVVAFVRGTKPWKFVGIFCPVKFSAVHNGTAHGGGVAVDVFGGGVGDNVGTPLDGTAVDGGGKGVVYNEGDTVAVGHLGKLFNVQHRQSWIGNGFPKDRLGVGPESGV